MRIIRRMPSRRAVITIITLILLISCIVSLSILYKKSVKSNEILIEKNSNLELEVSNLNNKINVMSDERDTLETKNKDLLDRIEECGEKITSLESENAKLKQEKANSTIMAAKQNELSVNNVELQYSKPYCVSTNPLTASKGVVYFNNHRETWYSQKVLPGGGLNIPGRHVADDGTIRDGDGYICISAHQSFASKGTILMTSLGPAKVYDTGCAYGTIDVYVNW